MISRICCTVICWHSTDHYVLISKDCNSPCIYVLYRYCVLTFSITSPISNMLRIPNVYLTSCWLVVSAVLCLLSLCCTIIVCWKSYLFVWVSMSLSLTSVLYGYLCCTSFYVAWSHFRWGLWCFNSESLIPSTTF